MSWIMVAAAAAKTIGALVEGSAQQAAFREAGAAHDYNAAVALQNAQSSWALASAQESMQRTKARTVLGGQAAQIAESGVTNTGSAVAVAKQSAANAELDSLLIQYHGDLQARGYEAQATSEQYAGDVARANARSARTAMWINAASAPLAVFGGATSNTGGNAQPTTLNSGGLGYGTAGSALAYGGGGPGYNGPW